MFQILQRLTCEGYLGMLWYFLPSGAVRESVDVESLCLASSVDLTGVGEAFFGARTSLNGHTARVIRAHKTLTACILKVLTKIQYSITYYRLQVFRTNTLLNVSCRDYSAGWRRYAHTSYRLFFRIYFNRREKEQGKRVLDWFWSCSLCSKLRSASGPPLLLWPDQRRWYHIFRGFYYNIYIQTPDCLDFAKQVY